MIRGFAPLALLIAAAAPAQEKPAADPAAPKITFSPEQGERWIPFERKNGLIFVEVLLDGKPARALIDNGFTVVALSKTYAAAHGLNLSSGGKAASPGGTLDIQQTAAPTLQLGGLSTTGGQIKVIDMANLSDQLGTPIDIAIGIPIIRGLTLQVDFDNQRLRFLPSGSKPLTGTTVPMNLVGEYLLVPLSASGSAPRQAMIDLGQQSQLEIAEATAADLAGKAVATDIAVGGVGSGLEIHKLLSLPAVSLGDAPFGPILAETEGPDQYLGTRKVAASIGIGMLSHYNFAMDVKTSSLTLTARTTNDPPASKTTVGVQVSYLADRISILHVMANSPAAGAGLKPGDAICAIDDVKVTPDWLNGPMGNWSTGAPGTAHRLSMCDGRTVALTTRAFY